MGKDIKRTAILEQIAAPGKQLWALEAGAGYGKSVLLQQLVAKYDRMVLHIPPPQESPDVASFTAELRAAGRVLELASAESEHNTRSLVRLLNRWHAPVIIDDCERWNSDVLALLGDVACDPMLAVSIYLSGRLIAGSGATLASAFQKLGHAEMAFTVAEVHDLLQASGVDDVALASTLHQLSGGWPAAISAAVDRMSPDASPESVLRRLARRGTIVHDTFAPHLASLSETDRTAATTLAGLPFFDTELADRAGGGGGGGTLAALRIAGLPVTERRDGWCEFAPTFRSSLLAEAIPVLPPEFVEYLAERGEIHSALNAFLASGLRSEAASLLAGVTRRQEVGLDPAELHAAISAIGDAADTAPRCLYVHAHVSAVHGHIAEGLESIERASAMFDAQDPEIRDPAHLETLLTLGIWRSHDGELLAAQKLVDRCEPAIDWTTPNENRAMMHDLRGVLHHQFASDKDLEIAASELKSGLAMWRQLNQPEAATVTLFRLASGVLACSGRQTEALALLDQLPELGPMTLLTGARLALERSWLLPYLDRANEVAPETAEVRRVARILDDKWLYASALISEIVAASFRYDTETVQALSAEAIDDGYITFADAAEANYWVEVAEALARCGESAAATEQARLIRAVQGVPDWLSDYLMASLEARHGNAATALALLEELSLRDDIERIRIWRIAVFRSYAHWRLGDFDDAAKFLDASFAEAAQIGLPALPVIAEGRLVDAISGHGPQPQVTPRTVISVFGEFSVQTNGQPANVPAGHATTLLKLLVINSRRVTIDQAIDALWPRADLMLGRRRLRNVLQRLRTARGDLIERQEDSLLLAASVESDFGQASTSRQNAFGPESLASAIALSDQPLLPADRYEDWADAARQRLSAEVVALLDRQSTNAESNGDIDLALRALQRAAALDPFHLARDRRIEDLLSRT